MPRAPLRTCLATKIPRVKTLLQVIRSEHGQPDTFLTRTKQSEDETKWHYQIGSFASGFSACYGISHIAGQLLSAGEGTFHKVTIVAMSDLSLENITQAPMSDMRALDSFNETEKRMIQTVTNFVDEEALGDQDEDEAIEAVLPYIEFQTREAFSSTAQGKVLENHLALARAWGWQAHIARTRT